MEDLEYCEEEAIKFILNQLPAEIKKKVKNEDVEYVLDAIYNFYDERGYLDEENDEVVDVSENEVLEYIMTQVENDKRSEQFTEDIVSAILDGEYKYCVSVGVFEEEDEE